MELQPVHYNKQQYVETASGNKVSRLSTLCGSQNIVLNGKTILMSDCVFRGDLANIRMGRYCSVGPGTVIRPSFKKFPKGVAFVPVHIGDHVIIEEGCVVMAAQIGSFVHVGRDAVIGRRSILKDCCAVLPDTVLPPDTICAPFQLWGGSPGRVVGQLPDATQELMAEASRGVYAAFVGEKQEQ